MRAPVQKLIDMGEAGAVAGMNRAAEAAGSAWRARAFELAAEFFAYPAKSLPGPFEILEARRYAENVGGLPPPPDSRAWGHIARKLKKFGVIKSAGVGKSSDPQQHRGYVTLWTPA